MQSKCPSCGELWVTPSGPANADILLAGEFPGEDEIKSGAPFTGRTGEILKQELRRNRAIKFEECRSANLWRHRKNKLCDIQKHKFLFLEELRKHKYALLMGSEFGKGLLYDGSVMDMIGRSIIIEGVICVVTINPAAIPKEGVGEFRESLKKFVEIVKHE